MGSLSPCERKLMAVRRGGGRQPMPTTDIDNETPSKRIVADANKLTDIVTKDGVTLTIRKLTTLDEMRLARAVGRDSNVEAYMSFCYMAAAIAAINGDRLPFPQTPLECEAIVQRIGDDGVTAMAFYAAKKTAEKQAETRRAQLANEPPLDAEREFTDEVKK